MNYEQIMYNATKLYTDLLNDNELIAINMLSRTDGNPAGVMGYDKVKEMFTIDDGKRMHQETKDALNRIVADRMGW